MTKKKVKPVWLITGGAGFIGSHIAKELVKRKQRVRIIDNFSTGQKKNIAPIADKIELIKGDLLNDKTLAKALKGVTYVSHQAALRSVPKSVDTPMLSNENNITATLKLLVAAKKAGVKKIVYASSSSVYGDCKKFPQKETMPASPMSPYAVSKLAAEHYCMVWAKSFGLEAAALRYFNVFGAGQLLENKYAVVIPMLIKLAYQNKPLTIHSRGQQSRDFTYIDNVVSANIKAMQSPKATGKVYNIACGSSHSILDIVKELERFCGKKLKKEFLPKRMGDVDKTYANISQAKKDFGYKVLVDFKTGLKKTWVARATF